MSNLSSTFDRADRLKRLSSMCLDMSNQALHKTDDDTDLSTDSSNDEQSLNQPTVSMNEFMVTVKYLTRTDSIKQSVDHDTDNESTDHSIKIDEIIQSIFDKNHQSHLTINGFAKLVDECIQYQNDQSNEQSTEGTEDEESKFIEYLCFNLDQQLNDQSINQSNKQSEMTSSVVDSLASTRLSLKQAELIASINQTNYQKAIKYCREIEKENSDMRNELDTIKQSVNVSNSSFESMSQSLVEHQATINQLINQKRELESINQSVKEALHSQQAQLHLERQARANSLNELNQANQTIKSLQSNNSSIIRSEFEKKKKEMSAILQSNRAIKDLQAQVSRLNNVEKECSTLRDRLQQADNQLIEYQRIVESMQSNNQSMNNFSHGYSLHDDLDSASTNASQSPSMVNSRRSSAVRPVDVSRRPSTVVSLNPINPQPNNQMIDLLNEKLADAEKALVEARASKEELERSNNQLNNQIDLLQSQMKQMIDEHNLSINQLINERDQAVNQLEESRAQWEAERTLLNETINQSINQAELIDQLKQRIADLEHQLFESNERWTNHVCPTLEPVVIQPVVPPVVQPVEQLIDRPIVWRLIDLSHDEQLEVSALAAFINQALKDDIDLAHVLPINQTNSELLAKVADGLIVAKLINHVANASIVDERVLNKRSVSRSINQCLTWYQLVENLNLCVSAAKAIGVTMRQSNTSSNESSRHNSNNHSVDLTDEPVTPGSINQTVSQSINQPGRGVELGDAQLQLMECATPSLVIDFLFQLLSVKWISSVQPKTHAQYLINQSIHPSDYQNEKAKFMGLSPEALMLAWLNQQLKKQQSNNQTLVVTNFASDFESGDVWNVLCDVFEEDQSNNQSIDQSANPLDRLAKLGVPHFHQTAKQTTRLNLFLLAVSFHTLAPLSKHDEVDQMINQSINLDDPSLSDNDREEVAFRAWLNAAGIPNLWCNDLAMNCKDGLLLLKLIDWLLPGSVDWKRVELRPSNKFKSVSNCNYALSLCKERLKLSLVGVGGEDLYDGHQKFILAVIWQIMRYHALRKLETLRAKRGSSNQTGSQTNNQLTDNDILEWANKAVARVNDSLPIKQSNNQTTKLSIKSFRDPALTNSLFLFALLHSINQSAVNWNQVKGPITNQSNNPSAPLAKSQTNSATLDHTISEILDHTTNIQTIHPSNNQSNNQSSDDLSLQDCLSNASYAIGVARKLGVEAWLRPQDIVECKPKMLMMLISSCMVIDCK